jgi:isopentenyl diphosphate isomerase/L-lactate dehydrogenase-like FMN-dependent dehydrogenase
MMSRRDLLGAAAGGVGLTMLGENQGPASGEDAKQIGAGVASPGVQRQMAIYLAGVAGQLPKQPISVEELEQAAKAAMKPEAYAYVAGGAGSESTVRENLAAFQRWRIVPRFLRNVEQRDLSVVILGKKHRVPFMAAPIGVQSIVHADAELATARAARAVEAPLVLSTLSSKPMEDVAKVMGPVPHWFQLYWPRNPELAASFVQRAQKAGFGAIVVTLDTYLLGWRERDLQKAYLPFVKGEGLANYFTDPVFRASLKAPPEKAPMPAIMAFLQTTSNPALTWEDLAFLRKQTSLPILLKGILDPEDATRAVDEGVDGIIVSNHGGRQVDGAIAALDALPGIAAIVEGKKPVLFDSGVRRGSDVFKAIALGAQAVLIGRPYCYGLALGGEYGAREVFANLIADIDITLGLAGCKSFDEVTREQLVESGMRPGES